VPAATRTLKMQAVQPSGSSATANSTAGVVTQKRRIPT